MAESRETEFWVVLWITFACATIITVLRLLSRKLKGIELWWDDYFALAGFTMSIGWQIIMTYFVKHGLGQHIDDYLEKKDGVTAEDVQFESLLLLFIIELIYAHGLFFAKVSLLCLYWRMFKLTRIRLPIQILMGCSVVWIIFRIFMGIFHCVPVNAFWDPSAGGYCAIQDKDFFFGTTLVHAVIDVAILILPMWEILQLQLPILQRLGIVLMFTFGFFICAAAIRLIVAARQIPDDSGDLTWIFSEVLIWATVEANLINVSASLPTIRPACKYLFLCSNPRSQTGDSYANFSSQRQTKNSIRLDPIHNKSGANDESSSTHQLAGDEESGHGPEYNFENHASDGFRPNGNNYTSTVTGRHGDAQANGGGIMVKNETTVRVSKSHGN